ncbi:MAG TPA: hypothetical protein PLL10_07730, partial [Elusimicrobiales bacterium]|nr:hypothetical protein [Elusimicrobiales bacterium]
MKYCKSFLVVAILPALLAACASIGIKTEGERVRAEGVAVYNAADPEGSRRAALLAAQRNAVEQVLGVFISAQTRVSKAELIDSKIMSASAGFIKHYSIENEKQEGSSYKISIKAVVLLDKVDQELGALRLEGTAPLAGVIVASYEEAGGLALAGRDAARAVEQELSKIGFKLLPYEEGKLQSQTVAAARAVGADYLVTVEGKAYKLDNGGALGDGFYPYRARVTVKAVAVDDGSTVANSAREAGGLDVAEAIAARKALAGAGEMAAKDIAAALDMAARSKTKTAQLSITGLTGLDQLRDFRKSVSGLAT